MATRNKLSIPTQRETQFLGLKWQHCGRPLLSPNSPFLSAFHHQLLIGSHKLEFGGMLPHTLQSLPHRGHVSLETGRVWVPIPSWTSFFGLPLHKLTPMFMCIWAYSTRIDTQLMLYRKHTGGGKDWRRLHNQWWLLVFKNCQINPNIRAWNFCSTGGGRAWFHEEITAQFRKAWWVIHWVYRISYSRLVILPANDRQGTQ